MSFFVTTAQSHLPINSLGYGFNQYQLRPFMPTSFAGSIDPNKKWQLKQYASLSAGYIFLNGGISYLSAPVGLMLFHPLNKNVSAFAAVSASPVFFSANRFYSDPMTTPVNRFSRSYGLGLSSRIEAGLMYTNDDKTFSISGSIGIEKGSYPVYPATRPSTKKL